MRPFIDTSVFVNVFTAGENTAGVAGESWVAATHGLQQADIDAMQPAFEHAERERAQTLTGSGPCNVAVTE